jgi:hypothetical protein
VLFVSVTESANWSLDVTHAARAALLAAVSILVACGSMAYDRDEGADAFRAASVSWVGAQPDEMIAVWGEPSGRVVEPAGGRSGVVRWRSTRSAGNATQAVAGHRCIVAARHGLDGTILRVDTISHNRDKRYAEVLDQLARPGS